MNTTTRKRRTRHARDLATLSHSELLDLKQKLTQDMADIRLRLAQARTVLSLTGQYADPGWYQGATHALRCKGLEAQAVQNELSRRKQERKNQNTNTLESRFIKIARTRLADDVFADILSEAGELAATRNETEPA